MQVPTPVPGLGTVQGCIEPKNGIPSSLLMPAEQIVRYCSSLDRVCSLSVTDQQMVEKIISPTDVYPGSNPQISSDGQWLAYMEESPDFMSINKLWIISLDSRNQFAIPWKPHWRGLVKWIDYSSLRIVDNSGISLNFNPFTGSEVIEQIPTEPPDIDPGNSFFSPIMIVSPNKQRFIYYDISGNYSMVDSSLNKALWTKKADPQLVVGLTGAKWSPDGKLVAITAGGKSGGELYVIDNSGVEVDRTDLASAFPSRQLLIGNFEWSPNGRQIAFWVNFGVGNPGGDIWNFFVLDMDTGVTRNYCIPSYGLGAHNHFPEVYWSPGSQKIVLQAYLGDDISENVQFVIDLSQNLAIKIPSSNFLGLIGWMNTP